ncbi:MAG: hypothetical protein U1E76_02505 [Planctomycetota bacterium]
MTRLRDWMAMATIGCLDAACASSPAPGVAPFAVRADLVASRSTRPYGMARATEDAQEGAFEGDNVDLRNDLDARGSFGYGCVLDVSLAADRELRSTYRLVDGFEGDHVLARARRFDGETFGPDERVAAEVEWERIALSYAQRLLAVRGHHFPDTDVLARLGVERSKFDMSLAGTVTPNEARQVLITAPFAGIEGRIAVLPSLLLWASADAGGWSNDGVHFLLADLAAGVRVDVSGPLQAILGYDLALRDGQIRDEEISAVRLLTHTVSLGVGVRF